MPYKLASLISTSTHKTGSATEVYIFQPDAEKEKLAGKLFVMTEVTSARANALKIINFLINSLNRNYYQNEKVILRERIRSLKVEHIFETALAKTNRDLEEFLKEERIKLTADDLNCTVGVIYESLLHFSNSGKNKAMLFYKEIQAKPIGKKEKTETTENYKVAALGKGEESKNKNKGEFKIFSDIISGAIPKEGYFLFSNEALPEYLSHKQLVETITKLPPLSAAEQIKNTLASINSYVSFYGVIIKNTDGEKEVRPGAAPEKIITSTSAGASLDDLRTTEEDTERYLSPSGIISAKKLTASLGKIFARKEKTNDRSTNKLFSLKDKVFVKRKSSLLFIKNFISYIKNFFLYLFGLGAWIFKNLTNKEKMASAGEKIKSLPKETKNKGYQASRWFITLNKKKKIIFGVFAICLTLFLVSVFVSNLNKKKVQEEEKLATMIENIEKKQNQVEAHLLYNNEEGAKSILLENDSLLADLSNQIKEDDERYATLVAEHEKQKNDIQHIFYLDNLVEIADFGNLNSQATADNLFYLENKIYAGDSKQGSIYVADLADNSTTAITDIGLNISRLDYPAADKEGNIYYLDTDEIIQLDSKNENLKNLKIDMPSNRDNIVAADIYSDRIYLLDKVAGEIYRYNKNDDGSFGQKSAWLAEDIDLNQAVDISIDGNIYTLLQDGSMIKLFSGKTSDFNIVTVDPKIESATKLFVSGNENGLIYILEPLNQRILTFDQGGKFLKQYKSEKFDNLKDFSLNEESGQIYFLNGNKVYAASLQ